MVQIFEIGLVVALLATVATVATIGGVVPLYLGSAWEIAGTGGGQSLVAGSSGTSGTIYDLAVGAGLAIAQVGTTVALSLSGAVVSAGTGLSMIASSTGVTTLRDLGTGAITTPVVTGTDVTLYPTASKIYPPTSVLSASSPVVTAASIGNWQGRISPAISDDGSTWVHIEATTNMYTAFNSTGYVDIVISVPPALVINSTYAASQYAYGRIFANVQCAGWGAISYPPIAQYRVTSVDYGATPSMVIQYTPSLTDTGIACVYSFSADVRLT